MEADIIVDGFNKSEVMHNLKFLSFIGDGDSSVHAKIISNVKYGKDILKVECINHLVKSVGKALYKIKKDTTIDVEGRKLLTSTSIKMIQNSILRCVDSSNGEVEVLKKLVGNIPSHVFGDHKNCNQQVCNVVGDTGSSKMATMRKTGLIYHINGEIFICFIYIYISSCFSAFFSYIH